ncbi:unnamed protein product [Nesidiocoris tenuis]|uniref:Uncharacterized protein n=1 Tax=Nesidiocoris tenuis TaxID=355587 RepID=A0A6H5FZF9_9HEMI|nr:unnamed protein product [Nesidiocoris tenuis]
MEVLCVIYAPLVSRMTPIELRCLRQFSVRTLWLSLLKEMTVPKNNVIFLIFITVVKAQSPCARCTSRGRSKFPMSSMARLQLPGPTSILKLVHRAPINFGHRPLRAVLPRCDVENQQVGVSQQQIRSSLRGYVFQTVASQSQLFESLGRWPSRTSQPANNNRITSVL